MMNAKEARENMKRYEEVQKVAQLARVNKWLENLEKEIVRASINGNGSVAVSDMGTPTDSAMACKMLKELGYIVTKISGKNALRVSWDE